MKIAWIPFKTWHSWTPEERGQVTAYYESLGHQWAIDMSEDKPKHERISDFEEYEGEAEQRRLDHRGYIKGS